MTEFVEWLTGTHKCGCGAEYKVTVTEAPTDNVTCEKCGRRSAPAIAAARLEPRDPAPSAHRVAGTLAIGGPRLAVWK